MKLRTIFLLLFGAVLLSSCSKDLMSLTVTRPAPVFLPEYVQKVGIIDRTLPSEKNEPLDVLDRVLSAEGKDFDKDGAAQALDGLFEELTRNERFATVKLLDVQMRSPGLGVFPSPLAWETVKKICEDNDLDALYTLDFYDTDTRGEYNTVPVNIKGPLGVNVPAVEHQARVTTLIKTGWRIYDPAAGVLSDEFVMNETVVSTGRGINPMKAAEAVMGRREQVMQVSNNLGSIYAQRILPYHLRVSRYYFVKGTRNFKIAKRRAQTRNWDGAAELWALEVDNRRRKVAGRACYNMAIISEINGDLEAAIDWASRSYTDYRNREALRYLRILQNRAADVERLASQN